MDDSFTVKLIKSIINAFRKYCQFSFHGEFNKKSKWKQISLHLVIINGLDFNI